MQIPNDQGGLWRMKKFVDYQHFAPPVDNAIFEVYAQENNFDFQDVVVHCWLHANFYHEITSLYVMKKVPYAKEYSQRFDDFFAENETKIQFGSAKKHMRYQNRINDVIRWFQEQTAGDPERWIKEISGYGRGERDSLKLYENIQIELLKCKNFARFAADLFCETFIVYQNLGLTPFKIQDDQTVNWYDGSNLTSGILCMNYLDTEADLYDAGKLSKSRLDELIPLLNETVKNLRKMIEETYPDQKIENKFFISKICSFRNLWKSGRYGGYHHDRQIEYIEKYKQDFPKEINFFNSFYSIRKKVFSIGMLGELNGWNSIRKERKKLWVEHGLTGVEPESNSITFKKKTKAQKEICSLNDF